MGLRGLGFLPHELGTRSTLPFVQAINLAERGFRLYPAHGETAAKGLKEAATSDIETLRACYRIDPSDDWRVRCGRDDALYVIDFPRDQDHVWCEKEFGPLPSTWLVTRPSGGTQHWFRTSSGDSNLKPVVSLLGSRAAVKASAPVPGSVHRKSKEKFSWVPGYAPGQCDLARLPRPWLMRLPKFGDVSITATPVLRPEWRDRAGRFPTHWQ
jgi:hypothetical protein